MPARMRQRAPSVDQLKRMLEAQDYVIDASMLTTLYLALSLKKPLLVWYGGNSESRGRATSHKPAPT